MVTPDRKGEIGYISGANIAQQTRPLKVKATTANIPVATESLQKTILSAGKHKFYVWFKLT